MNLNRISSSVYPPFFSSWVTGPSLLSSYLSLSCWAERSACAAVQQANVVAIIIGVIFSSSFSLREAVKKK